MDKACLGNVQEYSIRLHLLSVVYSVLNGVGATYM
jgi:hypothetical protein